jgi:GNAT superfamily N-acetyltransferase
LPLVVRRSIAECCALDHRNDAAVLEGWLSNKTPEHVRDWMASPDSFGVVGERDGSVVGFAMLTLRGEISICYVVAEAHGLGLGRAMVVALEEKAIERHLAEISLRSTQMAHSFYLRMGFVDSGPARLGRFITAHPMLKVFPRSETKR